MVTVIDIADIDLVYISYDEPQCEKHWVQLKKMAPWAKRVHGVEGSDAAHKAAAKLSETERVITVDGDNQIWPEFLDQQLLLTEENNDHTFSWRAVNHINNLFYGNGGLKCWPVEFILNMKTHEASTGDDTGSIVEFCWEGKYTQMFNCYSTTNINGSPYQAWRAGYREGVKLCLNKGIKPSKQFFTHEVHAKNLDLLKIWMTVGADVENGIYSVWGAKQGIYDLMLTDWDFKDVRDFKWLKSKFSKLVLDNALVESEKLSRILYESLGLLVPIFDKDQSKFFKSYYKVPRQRKFMTTEIDVIREMEGW